MVLLEQFRSIVLLPNFSELTPILIIACFWISFRHWLPAKGSIPIALYGLSILTGTIAKAITHSAELGAVTGGILAPAFYSILLICFGIARIVQRPYGHRLASAHTSRATHPFIRLLKGAIGGFIGGMTGSTLGALFSALLLLLFPLASPGYSFDWQHTHNLPAFISHSVLFFGAAGISLGILAGYGAINYRQLGDRLLFSCAIYLYVWVSLLKQMRHGRRNRSKE